MTNFEFSKQEIRLPSLIDPTSTYYADHCYDVGRLINQRVLNPEYLKEISETPEYNGALKFAIEIADERSLLLRQLNFSKIFRPDNKVKHIDYFDEAFTKSIDLLSSPDAETHKNAANFLQISLFSRAQEMINELYGPDFSETYYFMLRSVFAHISEDLHFLSQNPYRSYLGRNFEHFDKGIVESIKNSLSKPELIFGLINNNVRKINDYVDQLNMASVGDNIIPLNHGEPDLEVAVSTPGLDVALLRYLVENSFEISQLAEEYNYSSKTLEQMTIIAEEVVKTLDDRSEMIYTQDEDLKYHESYILKNIVSLDLYRLRFREKPAE